MGNINYDSFIKSSFFKELQSENRTTEELLNFVLSFIGLENFIKNYPKIFIEFHKHYKTKNLHLIYAVYISETPGVFRSKFC